MLRVIVRNTDVAVTVHAGAPCHTTHTTFDVDLPEIEDYLKSAGTYDYRAVIGVEVLPPELDGEEE